MTAVFMVVLVLAWLVVFLPSIRARHRAPLTTAERFRRDLETVALPRSSLAVAMSFGARPTLNVRAARLALFVFMCGCAIVTFGALFVRGSAVLDAHLAADAALMLYVAWLLEEKKKRPPRVRRPAVSQTVVERSAVRSERRITRAEWWDVRILDDEPTAERRVGSDNELDSLSEADPLFEIDDPIVLDEPSDEERAKQLA